VYIPLSLSLVREQCGYVDDSNDAVVNTSALDWHLQDWIAFLLRSLIPNTVTSINMEDFVVDPDCFAVMESHAQSQFPQVLAAMGHLARSERRLRRTVGDAGANSLVFCWTAAFQHPEPVQRHKFSIEIVDYNSDRRWIYDPQNMSTWDGQGSTSLQQQKGMAFLDGNVDQIFEEEVRNFFRDHAQGKLEPSPLPAPIDMQGNQATWLKIHKIAFAALTALMVCILWKTDHSESSESERRVKGAFALYTSSKLTRRMVFLLPLGLFHFAWESWSPGSHVFGLTLLKWLNSFLAVTICAELCKGHVAWPQLLKHFSSEAIALTPAVGMIIASGGCSQEGGC